MQQFLICDLSGMPNNGLSPDRVVAVSKINFKRKASFSLPLDGESYKLFQNLNFYRIVILGVAHNLLFESSEEVQPLVILRECSDRKIS